MRTVRTGELWSTQAMGGVGESDMVVVGDGCEWLKWWLVELSYLPLGLRLWLHCSVVKKYCQDPPKLRHSKVNLHPKPAANSTRELVSVSALLIQ